MNNVMMGSLRLRPDDSIVSPRPIRHGRVTYILAGSGNLSYIASSRMMQSIFPANIVVLQQLRKEKIHPYRLVFREFRSYTLSLSLYPASGILFLIFILSFCFFYQAVNVQYEPFFLTNLPLIQFMILTN